MLQPRLSHEEAELIQAVLADARRLLQVTVEMARDEDDMNEAWTACASLDPQGNPVVALRLTDGAIVYLHPDVARRFAHQISVALGDAEDE